MVPLIVSDCCSQLWLPLHVCLPSCTCAHTQLSENAAWVLNVDLTARIGRVFPGDGPSSDPVWRPFKVLAALFDLPSGRWGVLDTEHQVRSW
jgi:hypothetical protein